MKVGLLGFGVWAGISLAAVKEGKYLGYIAMDGNPFKIPVAMDVIDHSAMGSKTRAYTVFLRESLGNFFSHEYSSQYYEVPTGVGFILNAHDKGNGPDLSFTPSKISPDGRLMEGPVETIFGGPVKGTMQLAYWDEIKVLPKELETFFPKLVVVPTITGEFIGDCHGAPKKTQLEAVKETNGGGITPLPGYVVHGRIGREPSPNRVRYGIEDKADFTHRLSFADVGYNQYRNVLTFPSLGGKCAFTSDGFNCGNDCSLKRTTGLSPILASSDKVFRYASQFTPSVGAAVTPADLEGQYEGYLHLETVNRYERIVVTVSLTPIAGSTDVWLNLIGDVYVGAGPLATATFIPFSVSSRVASVGPATLKTIFSGESNATLELTSAAKDKLQGTWYSKTFGRVGDFEIAHVAGALPQIPFRSDSLAGNYRRYTGHHEMEELSVFVFPDARTFGPATFPFRITGIYRTKHEAISAHDTSREFFREIGGGYFDPFTRTLALTVNGTGQVVFGRITPEGYDAFVSGIAQWGKAVMSHIWHGPFERRPDPVE